MPDTDQANMRHGGQILADQLRIHGCDAAFCVAGESYLELLDALYDHKDFKLYSCRNETGAANAAEAYGKLTGKPGVVMVTRGPGACHGVIGLHTAHQDSTPLIMLIGQVARDQFDREAFQEIDYRRMLGQVTKWTAQIESADRIPEYLARAFATAMSGRPGPVALALPEDMLREFSAVGDAAPYQTVRAAPAPSGISGLRDMLTKAKKPLVVVGGGGWTPEAARDIGAFAEANDLPVACSFRRLDIMDHFGPSFVGDLSTAPAPKLLQMVKSADLLVVVGARLGEITTQGYEMLETPKPSKQFVHIHAHAEEIGSVYQPDLAIQSGMTEFAEAAKAMHPIQNPAWAGWRKDARAAFEAWAEPQAGDGELDLATCMIEIRKRTDADTIVTVDAGNFSGWAMRFMQFQNLRTFAAPTSGAMGYAVPAAVGASLAFPNRKVFGFVGDGGFMMTSQELATAKQYGGTPIIFLFDNGMYGTIRAHQAKRHPGRPMAIELQNPDFQKLIEAYGGHGETVTTTAEFGPALDRAIASNLSAVICLKMDPNVISTTTTLDKMEASARAAGL
jgi:acetolactate synthase-1/2/3 large subunit